MCSNECLPETVKKVSPESLPTVADTRVSGRRRGASSSLPLIVYLLSLSCLKHRPAPTTTAAPPVVVVVLLL
ncbi:hypothetical protein HanXRQr2_Chr13g0600041 [Helianthus annuus]|uniref:Uncharacterized protein n=1 Tax=Helianthus annuus TaxID=4232 RepID=A0A9K3EIQ6_HELAN|nr:hypothetical protein HanXRQr2_Chr13g0600041 [Helianthus annuus]KAJ0477757.1 hypothetical protein HanHA300_Chr13g0492261 [Helianthus annuus]KAJ0498589.1 hypothetical protein HanHA89_Chr13g0524381 [Helianthus annuus]KAJ0664603.1 hypothetical protein HanLR1_Chr13g0494381 [Helianthus annuus]KAJ0672054.1 hypothetical protein HanOQP8_Chr13g0492711 [Helianthus annuus]